MDSTDNVQKLKDAGCIPRDAKLSEAEARVVEALSDKEMEVLIGIRRKLDDEMAKTGTTAALGGPEEGGVEPSPNFIV